MSNIKSIDYEDFKFPEKLKNIDRPPKKIYLAGDISLIEIPAIAIIGSRNATEYGKKYAKIFAKELAKAGFCIVSGMAKGIDGIVHKSAIEVGGKTIAVLGSGFNNIYPPENTDLFYKIIETGNLVITEYDLNTKPSKENFPKRNRIVSGLSVGVLIIEAAYRSGTSITAKYAIKQGKDVFCIPNSIEESKGIGTNNLLKNGAQIVTSPIDIIEKYKELKLPKIQNKLEEAFINPEYKDVYKAIKNTKTEIEEIYAKVDKPVSEINMIITMLEMEGKIKQVSGTKYERT